MSALTSTLQDELITSWRAGMCDGLEMAAKMAQALIGHPETTAEQRAAFSGFCSALRSSGLEIAAQGRTR